jgi:heme-degrading monooxygenase HmoA
MIESMTPEARTAAEAGTSNGHVTLINCFTVPDGRDEVFEPMWTQTSMYFRKQPGFVSLRLHRAITPDARYRWVNVAVWESEEQYLAAHRTDEFRRLVTQDGWDEFPNMPNLYEVVAAVG